ncbi:hypothetical protein E2C01_018630 [Portunus trituberculatus]|uniref:Uncharacterized protein n=1 Tax=Portunus trituberculatus TaxID=210409 RepID=A0A5B7DX25_PORTR|nr:hypothetical protein [Portunus trituberculatus]
MAACVSHCLDPATPTAGCVYVYTYACTRAQQSAWRCTPVHFNFIETPNTRSECLKHLKRLELRSLSVSNPLGFI